MKTDRKDLPVNVRINMYTWANKSCGLMGAEPVPFLIGKLNTDGTPRDIAAAVVKLLDDSYEMAAATWTCDGVTYWYSKESGLCERPVGFSQADPWL
jgi:hypothetical protein